MLDNGKLGMSINEFAEVAGVSRTLAFQLARQNKLPVPVIFLGEKRMILSRKAVNALFGDDAKPGSGPKQEEKR